MKITMLGTGNAQVTECYNTCFVLEEEGRCLLVDGGGGNTLLRQLKRAGYDWMDMREIFVTHRHVDHLLGILWMMRMICQNMHRGTVSGRSLDLRSRRSDQDPLRHGGEAPVKERQRLYRRQASYGDAP